MNICELCSKEHYGEYGSGRFCCPKCARAFSTKAKRKEINEKVSKTLTKQKPEFKQVICVCCNTIFETKYTSKSRICSDECRFILKSEASKLGRRTAKERGTFTGWKVRTKEPSYAEKYFISLFENENIVGYVRELNVGKWFIDFAFPDLKLAIEVDGKQHEYEERKISDLEKDRHLNELGWIVFRIKWKNPISDSNRNFLYCQIDEMKKLLISRGRG